MISNYIVPLIQEENQQTLLTQLILNQFIQRTHNSYVDHHYHHHITFIIIYTTIYCTLIAMLYHIINTDVVVGS